MVECHLAFTSFDFLEATQAEKAPMKGFEFEGEAYEILIQEWGQKG